MSFSRAPFLVSLLLFSTSLLADSANNNADIVLHNAKIYTVDSQQNWAQAVAIKGGKISYVGSDEGVKNHKNGNTRVIDMQGQFILPSFQDAHIHPVSSGVAQTAGCPVFNMDGSEIILKAITQCVKKDPKAAVIFGYGWGMDDFSAGKPIHRSMLDEIDSTRPLYFGDSDAHTLWLNSAALDFAGITKDTPDPEGGKIGRDEITGELTGLLMEDAGMELLLSKLPPPKIEVLKQGLKMAQGYLNGLGITAVQDAIVKVSGFDNYVSLPAYREMADSGELKLRVVAALHWNASKGMAQIDELVAARQQYSGGRLQASTIKFWADGILESHTAKMLAPYTDKPESTGLMMVPREQLMTAGPALDKLGFQLHIHAIGSATVRYALDTIEASQKANGRRDARHHIAHVQMVHPDDIPRFASLDATATIQPLWAYANTYTIDINTPQVGPKRMQWMYPTASIANSGGRLAFGSDWSVDTANPFPAIEIALTRQDPETTTSPVFNAAERISLKQAIAGYTIGAAYINFLDDSTGSIEVGKYADIIVLDRNLFEIPVTEISETKVLVTLLEGEEVHGKL